jgi:hypothetical protein
MLPIREKALKEQGLAVVHSLAATKSEHRKHFIQQFAKASWTKSPNIDRIWLGLWNQDTLKQLMKPSIKADMSNQTRQSYIKLTRKLTKPLLSAYYTMQDIFTHTTHPTPQTHITHTASSFIQIPHTLRDILENTHIQSTSTQAPSILHQLDHIDNISSYTLSDAAFGLTNADGTV